MEIEDEAARYGRELSTIFESITDAFFALDTEWRFIYMNSEAENVLFSTREELLGQNVWEEFPAAKELSFYPQYHKSMNERVTVEFEEYYPPLETWVEAKAYPSELGISVYFREINDRKRAEEERRQSEERLRSVLVQYGSDIITILDSEANITYQSPAVEQVLGYEPEEYIGRNALEFVHPDDGERVYRELAKLMNEGNVSPTVEYRFQQARGGWRWLEGVANDLLHESGIEGIVVNSRDVTERKQAEEEIRRSKERLQTVIDNAPVILFAMDSEGVFTLCEGKALESLNLANNEMVGTSFFDLSSDQPEIIRDSKKALSGETFTSMLEFGGLIFEVHYSPLKDEDGEVTGVIGLANEVTERERLQSQLEHQALHDTLTDLPNRALFNDRITKALERAERSGECVAVMFLDLDNFKHVNDSLGHSMGDELLVSVARRLSSCLRPSDTVARMGGDEFTILLDGVGGEDEASHIAERIISQFRSPITLNDGGMEREVFTTASAGVVLTAPATEGRHSSEELLQRADTTLYRAKDGGRDNYLIFQQEMKERSVERFNLEKELRRGIEREELLLHYQPVVCMDSGSTCGFEALVRWENPERGLVSPAEFIPLAEDTGLIVGIGRWVLREACHQAMLWRQHLPSERPFSISVNLSPRQLRHPGIVEDVAGVLAETGLPPDSLELEITESVFIEDERTGFARVRELKELGVSLALDDFGTGYSSLSYLKSLPIDTLKIDRSFIRDIECDPEDKAFVSAILSLADSLGIKVVSEGVETSEQLDALREPGPELAQGYYFAKPMPSRQAWEYLMGP